MDRGFRAALERVLLMVGCLLSIPAIVDAQDDAAPPEPAADLAAPLPVDPSRSPLASDPKSADELLEATLLMVDIARLDLAELYLNKLLAETLDDETLLALRDKYGAAAFLKLARIDQLNPGAAKLLDLSNAAAIKQANDPERIARLIADLHEELEARAVAEAELISLGTPVVPGLLAVLVDPVREKEHDAVLESILLIGQRAVPPLLGALTAPTAASTFRGHVITLLGQLEARAAVPYLWHPAQAPDESEDVRLAARNALARILGVTAETVGRLATEGTVARMLDDVREDFRHQHAWKTDENGKVSLWLWNAQQGTVAVRLLSPDEASDIVGLRLAREALSLAPDLRSTQVMYLALFLAADTRRIGFNRPLPEGPGTAHDTALAAGSEVALDVVAEALSSQRPAVAVAALKVFSEIGTLAQLQLAGGRKSVVVSAMDDPDPRVQFAAASAILQIDPTTPFRGAVRVVEILKRALVSDGRVHAVVGEVLPDRGAMIGGILREMGYEPLVFNSGREAFAAAAGRSDVELVVLHPNLIRWPLTETLANLRADSRTASIPIVIHGPSDLTRKMERKAHNYRLVAFSSAAETTSDFDRQLTPLLRQIKQVSMNAQERSAQRAAAAAWLAHIAQGRRTRIFDIRPAEPELVNLLNDEDLAPHALECLGEIATRTSQQRLAVVALDSQAPLDLRRSAAYKLAFHIQRFGLTLTKDEIAGLHKVWEAGREPAELRTAVGSVIGSLKPDATLAGKRLQQQSGKK